ncbi:hypothetical protein BD413DRAFT_590144 [Trametes elegans]|nr:hypothetical protein BD413DRAFT_590144 [Trametes elegans]
MDGRRAIVIRGVEKSAGVAGCNVLSCARAARSTGCRHGPRPCRSHCESATTDTVLRRTYVMLDTRPGARGVGKAQGPMARLLCAKYLRVLAGGVTVPTTSIPAHVAAVRARWRRGLRGFSNAGCEQCMCVGGKGWAMGDGCVHAVRDGVTVHDFGSRAQTGRRCGGPWETN